MHDVFSRMPAVLVEILSHTCIHTQATYFLGGLLIIGACTWNWFVRKNPSWEIFGSSVLLGAGCSTILVTSLSMTADLIGDQTVSLIKPLKLSCGFTSCLFYSILFKNGYTLCSKVVRLFMEPWVWQINSQMGLQLSLSSTYTRASKSYKVRSQITKIPFVKLSQANELFICQNLSKLVNYIDMVNFVFLVIS